MSEGAMDRAQTQSRHLFRLALFVSMAIVCLHVALGANVFVLLVALLTVVAGTYPIARYSVLNIGSLLLALLAFRYVGFPLLGKLFFGQPLDSNLIQPFSSFLVVLLGIIAYAASFKLAALSNIGRPLLPPISDSGRLRRISVIAAAIGLWANLAVAFRAGEHYAGVTVGDFFTPFLHLSLIAAVASVLVKSGCRRSLDSWTVIIIFAEVIFAATHNSRMTLLETFLAYALTVWAFRGHVNWRLVGALGVIIVLISIFITPVILQVRNVRSDLSWTQRIERTIHLIANWDATAAAYGARERFQSFSLFYYGTSQNTLERMSLVRDVDVIKSGFDQTNQVGFEDIGRAIKRAIPSFLVSDKPRGYGHGDWLYCEAGIRCFKGSYLIAPLVVNGYAAFGWAGVVFYPILLGFPLLLIIKKVSGWSLYANIWAVYLFIRVQNMFVEGHSLQYIAAILRNLPQDAILLVFILVLSRYTFSRRADESAA